MRRKDETMNQEFLFRVAAYPRDLEGDARKEQTKVGELVSTGSQETRARRRLLRHLHDQGFMAARIDLVAFRPASRRPQNDQ